MEVLTRLSKEHRPIALALVCLATLFTWIGTGVEWFALSVSVPFFGDLRVTVGLF